MEGQCAFYCFCLRALVDVPQRIKWTSRPRRFTVGTDRLLYKRPCDSRLDGKLETPEASALGVFFLAIGATHD